MKLSSVSFLLMLLTCAFLVSGASENAEERKTPSPATENKQGETTESKNADAQKSPSSSAPLVIVVNNPPPKKEESVTKDESAYWPPIWSNWALVVAGIVAGYIGLRTLNAVKRQAIAAERTLSSIERQVIANETSANAAQTNASIADQTLKTAERAWLSVTFNKPFKVQEGTANPVVYSVKNTGKGVAFLKVKKLRSMPWPDSVIPERPLDPKPMGEYPTLMAIFPNDVVELEGIVDIDFRGEFFNQMIAGRKIFDVYGYVAYDDIFKIRHITRYCYAFNPGENINQGTGKFDYIRDPHPGYSDAD